MFLLFSVGNETFTHTDTELSALLSFLLKHCQLFLSLFSLSPFFLSLSLLLLSILVRLCFGYFSYQYPLFSATLPSSPSLFPLLLSLSCSSVVFISHLYQNNHPNKTDTCRRELVSPGARDYCELWVVTYEPCLPPLSSGFSFLSVFLFLLDLG